MTAERKRWTFIWVVFGFAMVTYVVALIRPDVPAPGWIAPVMALVAGVAVAQPAAAAVLNGSKKRPDPEPPEAQP